MTGRPIGAVRASRRFLLAVVPLSLLLIALPSPRTQPTTVPQAAAAPSPTATTARTLPARLAPVAAAALAADDDAYTPHPAVDDPTTLRATNPAQRFTPVFTPNGLRLTSDATASAWGMHLAAIGSGDALVPVSTVLPTVQNGRVEYQRGAITEWYVNSPLGVEQGVTLAARPADAGTGEVTLVIALDGAVTPTMDEGGVTLTSASGSRLRYGQMTVTDATGRAVPARMTVENATIRLSVDDAGAVYPVVVDPLIQEQELTASDGAANDYFGWSVALSADGNTALIGAPLKKVGSNIAQGAAYVFVRSGTTWSQQTTPSLLASDGATNDEFGYAVALSGDGNTALIGAYAKNVGSNTYQGAAYVFVRSGTTWSQQTTPSLLASDGAGSDVFGWSVALSADGTTALIGASGKSSDKGAAYVFVRSGTTWSQQTAPSLLASDGAANDLFGASVALSADGNTALIGAYFKNSNKGAAYVFVRSGTVWSQQTTPSLLASDGAAGDRFGYAVALSADGTTALIGAYSKSSLKGAAYIFVRSGTTWSQQTTPSLLASDGAAGDSFGYAVALSADGNTALIGASGKNSHKGAAYVFVRSGTTWSQQTTPSLTASDGAANDFFGYAVALSADGNTALIGAYAKNVGSNTYQGAAYLFATPTLHLIAPASSPAGAPFSLTLSVTDATGIPLPLYTGTVHFSSTDPHATLPANFSFTAADNGTHTFPSAATLTTAGSRTITATDTTLATVTATATITISAGPPASLVANAGTTPQSAPLNTAFATPLAVTVTDTFGNPVSGITVSFTAPTTGATGSFTGFGSSATAVTNASGVATAPAFTANGAVGSYTVTASTPGTTAASFALTNTVASAAGGLQFYPLAAPVRLLDTRPGQNAVVHPGVPLTPNQALSLPGQFSSGGVTVPAGAQALVGNATVDNSVNAPAGFATLYPSGAALPLASNLNFVPGTVRPNAFTVGLGADGKFNLLSNTGGNFIIDITGYYAPPGTGGLFFHPLTAPVRLLDTRAGQSAVVHPNAALTPGQTLNLPGQFTANGVTIPSSAKALAGNATVDNTANAPAGFATLFPGGTPLPPTSNLNFAPGTVAPNAFTVGLGADASFNLYSSTGGNFILDVTGYYDTNGAGGLLFYPLAQPVRELDTRAGQAASVHPGVPLTAKQTLNLPGSFTFSGVTVPAGAKALVGNATVDNTINAPDGFATLFPGGTTLPLASNLNYSAGTVAPNAFIVGIGADGTYNLYSLSGGNFIIDISGYFAAGTGTSAAKT